MASGYLNRIESAFAEAALDSGWWGRAFKNSRDWKFRSHCSPSRGRSDLRSNISRVGGVVGPGDVCAGLLVAPDAALHNRAPGHLTYVRRRRHAEKNSRDEHKVMNA